MSEKATLIAVFALLVPGCSVLKFRESPEFEPGAREPAAEEPSKAQGKAPESEPDAEEDDDDWDDEEEGGVDSIIACVRKSNDALEVKKFAKARKWLRRAERGIKQADELTRGHPEFEDLIGRVERAYRRLDAAVERDRIERRNAAMAKLTRRAENAFARGYELQRELKLRAPIAEDTEMLAEIISELRDCREQGVEYLDDQDFRAHSDKRDSNMDALTRRRNALKWQLRLSDALKGPLEKAVQAGDAARKAETPGARIEALTSLANAFAACGSAIESSAAQEHADGGFKIETPMGWLSVNEAKRRCRDRRNKATTQLHRLEWHENVQVAVGRLGDALGVLRAAKDAQGTLDASGGALEALADCRSALKEASKHPGHDARASFSTAFGRLNVNRLIDACSKEHARLTRLQPRLRWRTSFEGLGERASQTHAKSEAAGREEDPATRREAWGAVISELEACVKEAEALSKDQQADASFAASTTYGNLTHRGLKRTCAEELEHARKQHRKATEAEKLERFCEGAKADEVTLARREGIPTRIEQVEGGRVFIYETRGKGGVKLKRFGFDTSGKRVDFRLKWRKEIETLVSEIGQAMAASRKANNGTQMLAAGMSVVSLLARCHESLAKTVSHPGYDATRRFNTALGKLGAVELRTACGKTKGKVEASLPGIRWRIKLEELRDRVKEAESALRRAGKQQSGSDKVDLAGEALGGLRECVEQAEALRKAPGHDRRLKIETPYGQQSVDGLARKCKGEIARADKAMGEALEAERLEEFLETCKGDEAAVARREGLPTRVEEMDSGRVFIYEKAGKPARKAGGKRYAFDKQGKRVDEKVLRGRKRSRGRSRSR